MTTTAQGILKHHFWGTYHATIGLKFADRNHAAIVHDRYLTADRGWVMTELNRVYGVLRFHGTGEGLKQAERDLVSAGADPNKLGSLRFSVDVGEPFIASFDITPEPTETQIGLFA